MFIACGSAWRADPQVTHGVVTSRNSQGTVPSRDGVPQAYLRLGTMFHARNPTQTDNTSHVHRAPLIRTASAVTFGRWPTEMALWAD